MRVLIAGECNKFTKLIADYLPGKIEQLSIQFLNFLDNQSESLEQWEPDVILLTTNLTNPGDKGIAHLVKQFLLDWPSGKIVIYGQGNIDLIKECFQLGLKGWITPETSLSELVSCVLQVSGGGRFLDTSTLIKLMFLDDEIEKEL